MRPASDLWTERGAAGTGGSSWISFPGGNMSRSELVGALKFWLGVCNVPGLLVFLAADLGLILFFIYLSSR